MSGTFTAIDSKTNTIAWQHKTPYRIGGGGGSSVTAGGLVFRGEPDGNFLALDAKSGKELWRFQTGFGADAPPVFYEVDDEQYVTIATGGNQLQGSAYGDAVWAFSLKGQLGPLWPPPPPQTVAGPTGPIVAGADTVRMGANNVEYSFGPSRIRIKAGATVTFTNVGDLPHSATSMDRGKWDTGVLVKGGPPAATDGLQVLLTTSELIVGQNRLAFGLLKDGRLLVDARVSVRLYAIEGEDARLVAETPARYHRLEVIEEGKRIHIHPDGARHVHGDATDVQGIYVAHVTFQRSGTWGLEILAQSGSGAVESARLSVGALAVSLAPMVGTPAPRSRNRIASDVSDLRQIDSSDPPDPRLHRTRIADAIAQGKPQVIVFATPRYCTSRVCGPVVDIVRTLIPTYGDRVAFIHEEI